MSTPDVEWDTWFGDEIPERIKPDKKYDLLKASPAEAKTFSPEDQRYWLYGQILFRACSTRFAQKEDEVVEGELPSDSESSEESESEESESEEESEKSNDEPNSKEAKRNNNRGYGPRGLVYPTEAA